MALAFSFGGIGTVFLSRNFKIFQWGTLPHSLDAWLLLTRCVGRQYERREGGVLQGGR